MKRLLLLCTIVLCSSTSWSYCTPTFGNSCLSDDFINDFTFNTISNLGTGCENPGLENYSNYTNLWTFVVQNSTYQMSVAPGPDWGEYFVAFIDWNDDNDFSDPGEFYNIGYASAGTTISTNILIPTGLAGGDKICRVMCRYGSTPLTQADECALLTLYGEVEHYKIKVNAELANDAGLPSFVTPVQPTCNFSVPVSVELFNYGYNNLTSVEIDWKRNGANQPTVFWTGNLPQFSSETVVLGVVPLAQGVDLWAKTVDPNGVGEPGGGAWNSEVEIIDLQAGMSGTYTIGGVAPNYTNFNDAVDDLNLKGICGDVIFNVRPGIYNEQIILKEVEGANTSNSITFRSENGVVSSVKLRYAALLATDDNFVVRMDGGDHFRFEDFTMEATGLVKAMVMDYQGGADSNHVIGCHLHSFKDTVSTSSSVIYSNDDVDNYNIFVNNTIEGGSYGAYWYGDGSSDLELGTIFDSNHFLGNFRYGTRLKYQDAPFFTNNRIDGPSTYLGTRYGGYFETCDNAAVITGNEIYGDQLTNSGFQYGLYMLDFGGTALNRGLIQNNMVHVAMPTTSTHYGMYFVNSNYCNINHNSILVTGGSATSRALYTSLGTQNTLINNILSTQTAGYAIYMANNNTFSTMNYNNLHSPSGPIAYYGGANRSTLAIFQTVSGTNANSISVNPFFHDIDDLHVCSDSLDNKGTFVTTNLDFDGEVRSLTTPDMGADEFTGIVTNVLGNDIDLCIGDSLHLGFVPLPTDTYFWSTGETTDSIWVNTGGTYTLTVTGNCSFTDVVTLAYATDVYTAYLSHDTTQLCVGDSAMLYTTTLADTYTWSTGESADTIWVSAPGMYYLDIEDNCGSGMDSVMINPITNIYTSYLDANAIEMCVGDSVQLYSTLPADAFTWSTGESADSIWVSAAGTYYLNIADGCGAGIDSIDVTHTALTYTNFLSATATQLCTGETTVLSSTIPADTYAWSYGPTTPSVTTAAPGTYYLNIADNCGSGIDSVTIDAINNVYSGFLSSAVSEICVGDSVQLISTVPATSYTWSTGDPFSTIWATAPGEYFLNISDICGAGVDSITINAVNNVYSNFLTSTGTAICSGDSVLVSSTIPGINYAWSSGESSSTLWISTPGTYTLDLTASCGAGTDVITIAPINNTYSNFLTSDVTAICSGDSVQLYSTTPADSYSWSTGASSDSLWVSAGGNYTLNIADNCGSGTDMITITAINNTYSNFLTSDVTAICSGDSVQLYSTTPADSYSWSTGDSSDSLWVSTAGSYTLNISDNCGSGSDMITITAINNTYTAFLESDLTAICTGDSVQMYSSILADSYSWSTGDSSDSLWVSTAGTYYLDISDNCGSGTDSLTLAVSPGPTAGFTSSTTGLSIDFTNTSTTSGSTTYSWDFGDLGTSAAVDPTHVYATAGTYYVELTVTNDCGTDVFGVSVTTDNVGLTEIPDIGFISVYPNPSTGEFQLDFDLIKSTDLHIEVTNPLGELILVREIGTVNGLHNETIDLTDRASGIFFISIFSNDEEVVMKRVMKK